MHISWTTGPQIRFTYQNVQNFECRWMALCPPKAIHSHIFLNIGFCCFFLAFSLVFAISLVFVISHVFAINPYTMGSSFTPLRDYPWFYNKLQVHKIMSCNFNVKYSHFFCFNGDLCISCQNDIHDIMLLPEVLVRQFSTEFLISPCVEHMKLPKNVTGFIGSGVQGITCFAHA